MYALRIGAMPDASEDSDEFSNGEFDDSAFEESPNGSPNRRKKEVPLSNDKYDLALNVSASMDDVSGQIHLQSGLSVRGEDSHITVSATLLCVCLQVADLGQSGRRGGGSAKSSGRDNREKLLKNDKFDEALDVSASHASSDFPPRDAARSLQFNAFVHASISIAVSSVSVSFGIYTLRLLS